MISLTMIVKDGLDDLKRLKPIVEPYIDEWVVVFPPKDKAITWAKKNGIKAVVRNFTQEIEPEVRERMASFGVQVADDYRLFNFAAARNKALEEASGDYILWLDADDEPHGIDKLSTIIENNTNVDIFDALYDYGRDAEGNPISNHVRERVFKNNGQFTWKGGELGLIHETLLPVDEETADFVREEIDPDDFKVVHLLDDEHMNNSSARNHVALAYEYIKTSGKDPRTTYYLATECFNRGLYDHCIKLLEEYVSVSGWEEEKYHAYLKMGNAYRMRGYPKNAIRAYHDAMDVLPNYPHAYHAIGEAYHELDEYGKSIDFMLTGMAKKIPKTKYVTDMVALTFRPAIYVALGYLQLGKPKDAYDWFARAVKMNPKHPWVNRYKDLFLDSKDLNDYVTAFVQLGQLSQRLYPQTLSKLAEVVPDKLMDQELLMDFKWRYSKPKIWPRNSIVYFCSSAFEDWGPESLKTGTGGSEEAVIQLTKRWAKMGYEVTVYNNCIREGRVDGVNWVRYERFNPRDMFNVLISWRNNAFTEPKSARKKIIDMHDVPTPAAYYKAKQVEGTKVAVKSQYHRSLMPDVPDDQFLIIPNGIELKTLEAKPSEKKKNNIVWTSSYDRGLEHLLNMWSSIKKAIPDVSLEVYYGWNLYDTTPWGRTPTGQQWKRRMEELLKQDGITEHGRVGSEEIALAYKKADIWAYPTDFPEICAITLTKSMAAGVVPISTDFAVMPERNQGIIIKGNISEELTKEKFKRELISLLKDEKKKEEIRNKIDVNSFDWDNIAQSWSEEFTQ